MFFKKSTERKVSFLERLVSAENVDERKSASRDSFIVPQEKIAPPGSGFFLHSGKELRTIRELVSELTEMSDDEWRQYANFGNNHFANWIEGVFGEKELGVRVRQAQDRETMRGVLSVFLL